jgi:hypothetical protein
VAVGPEARSADGVFHLAKRRENLTASPGPRAADFRVRTYVGPPSSPVEAWRRGCRTRRRYRVSACGARQILDPRSDVVQSSFSTGVVELARSHPVIIHEPTMNQGAVFVAASAREQL